MTEYEKARYEMASYEVETMQTCLKNPDWENKPSPYGCVDWRNFISKEIAEEWDTFTDRQKQMLYRQAIYRVSCLPDPIGL